MFSFFSFFLFFFFSYWIGLWIGVLVYGVAAAMVRDTAHSAGDGGETPPSVVRVCQNQKREKNKKTMSNTSRCSSVQQGRVIVTLLSLSLSVSGVCECSDFTAGMTCEHCLDGYYGNALIGTPGDCQPCPCPDRTSCSQIAETGQVVCTNCPAGRTGEMTTSDAASFLFLSFSFFFFF